MLVNSKKLFKKDKRLFLEACFNEVWKYNVLFVVLTIPFYFANDLSIDYVLTFHLFGPTLIELFNYIINRYYKYSRINMKYVYINDYSTKYCEEGIIEID